MDAGPLPPPPTPAGVPPRPDLFPAGTGVPAPAVRRRRRGTVLVAAIVAAALLVTAIASVAGSPAGGSLSFETNGDYRFLQRAADGRPFRWDPCLPIHYEVNLADAPPGALDDVRGAVARVAEASGLRFVYDGTTSRTIDQQMGHVFQTGSTSSRWFPVLIAWVPHEHFDYLAESHRAAAFGMPRAGDGADFATYESGLIAIDAGGRLPTGFAARYSEGVVLMHEWGHVLGLGHVGTGDELMYSPNVPDADTRPDPWLNDWGPGDRHGLEILGEHGPCDVPAN